MSNLAGFSYPDHGKKHAIRIKTGEIQKLREDIPTWAYFHISERRCYDDLCQEFHCNCSTCMDEFEDWYFARERAKDNFLFEQKYGQPGTMGDW